MTSARISHHWGGPTAVPRDWSMTATLDRQAGLGSAAGYAGHGLVASNIAERTVRDFVLGRTTDLLEHAWLGHRNPLWEPEPLRFVASNAIIRVLNSADHKENSTGRPTARTKILAPVLPSSSGGRQ